MFLKQMETFLQLMKLFLTTKDVLTGEATQRRLDEMERKSQEDARMLATMQSQNMMLTTAAMSANASPRAPAMNTQLGDETTLGMAPRTPQDWPRSNSSMGSSPTHLRILKARFVHGLVS